jgi:hypothetical protein
MRVEIMDWMPKGKVFRLSIIPEETDESRIYHQMREVLIDWKGLLQLQKLLNTMVFTGRLFDLTGLTVIYCEGCGKILRTQNKPLPLLSAFEFCTEECQKHWDEHIWEIGDGTEEEGME